MRKYHFPTASIPVMLAGLCLAAFGLLLPYLGYYQDDWHHLYYAYARGLDGLRELFLYDGRPLAAFFYIAAFKLLGFQPVFWQAYTLALRILTVIVVWLSLAAVWPRATRQTAWAAVLFAVYPIFNLQALSVTYNVHWVGYLFWALSIWTMLLSVRRPNRAGLFTGLSVVTAALHMALLEYFVGLELIRPVLLWLLASEREGTAAERLKWVGRRWLPYTLLLLAYGAYRILLVPALAPQAGLDASSTILDDLLRAPLGTLVHLLQNVLQDMVTLLYSTWNKVINPSLFALTDPSSLRSLAVAILAAVLLFVFFTQLPGGDESEMQPGENWPKQAFWTGLVLALIGVIPVWAFGRGITDANPLWSGRFGMASMPGASLMVVALAEGLVRSERIRTLLLCGLVGATLSWQITNMNDFRWAWVKQARFYQQLLWRAPYIQPDTALLADGELFSFMGEYPTSFAISTLYSERQDGRQIPYWFFGLYKHFNDKRQDLLQGMRLNDGVYSVNFSADSRDSLVIAYQPEQGQCLWVLSPDYAAVSSLPEISLAMLPISNLSRILPEPQGETAFAAQSFGSGEGEYWCYYYEKGDLARQQGDWAGVVALWQQAAKNKIKPGNGVEYIPFIQGFAHLGNWQKAAELTLQANPHQIRAISQPLCHAWQGLLAEGPVSPQSQTAWASVNAALECAP